MSKFKQGYVIGGDKYYSRPDGAAMFGPPEQRLPILSFAGVCAASIMTHYYKFSDDS